ncbi:MAG TPA: hypothetical protein PLD46_02705 [Hyphomicrobium sp.]|nr:hypothetical protein [Hyphomicrobium sp.]
MFTRSDFRLTKRGIGSPLPDGTPAASLVGWAATTPAMATLEIAKTAAKAARPKIDGLVNARPYPRDAFGGKIGANCTADLLDGFGAEFGAVI